MKISKILFSLAAAFSLTNADVLGDLQSIDSSSASFNKAKQDIIKRQTEIIELEKQNSDKAPYAKRDLAILVDNLIKKSLQDNDQQSFLSLVKVNNVINNINDTDDKNFAINYHQKNIAMLEELKTKPNQNIDFINSFKNTEIEILDILQGKTKIEEESYSGQILGQLEKTIYDSLTTNFYETINNNDYMGFKQTLDIYKLYKGIDIDPNDFLDELLQNKNLKFLQILKDNGCDSSVIRTDKARTLLNYLKENKADKEILKIFE